MSVILRERKLKNGTISYFLDIHHKGERYQEFLSAKIKKSNKKADNKEIKRIAQVLRAEREVSILRDDYEVPDIKKQRKSFTKYFENYKGNYTKNDIRKIKSSYKKYKEYFGNITAKRLNYKKCNNFLKFLQEHKDIKSDETVKSYFGVFRKVINSAIRDGLLKSNPTTGIKVKKSRPQLHKQILEIHEIEELQNAYCGNDEVKRAFLFTCFTGLGISECRKLTWSRINNKKLSHFSRSKTETPLTINLHENAMYYLGKRGKPGDLVFNLPSTNGFNKVLKNWVKRTSIEKHITSYCGRHSFACMLLVNGANPKTVADLLGHTSINVVDKYLKHVSQLNKKAVDNIPTIVPKTKMKVV